jgi:phosphonoacetaldehyde hydrolase
MSGNAFGLNPAETAALSANERATLREAAYADLRRSGAHYVIDSVANIDAVLDDIDGRLARGGRP